MAVRFHLTATLSPGCDWSDSIRRKEDRQTTGDVMHSKNYLLLFSLTGLVAYKRSMPCQWYTACFKILGCQSETPQRVKGRKSFFQFQNPLYTLEEYCRMFGTRQLIVISPYRIMTAQYQNDFLSFDRQASLGVSYTSLHAIPTHQRNSKHDQITVEYSSGFPSTNECLR